MATSTTSTTEERALTLLGQGVPPQAVANALGVDISRISQLLSQDDFASKVVERKFESLSKNNERDGSIDNLEDKLITKLENCLPFMTRPMELVKAFQVINAAKRRGSAAPDPVMQNQTIIQLNIPAIILNKFSTNINNQVVQVGERSLLTIPSGQMIKLAEAQNAPNILENQPSEYYDPNTNRPESQTVSAKQSSSPKNAT